MVSVRLVAGNEEASPTRRGSPRSRVLLSATIKNAFGEHPVKIRDISSTGAMIQAPVVPPVGSRLLLIRGEILVAATVVWTGSGKYGLHFHGVIDEAAMLVAVASARNAGPAEPRKAIFPLPEEESKPKLAVVSKH